MDIKLIIRMNMTWLVFGLWCLTPHSTIVPVIWWRSFLLVEETGGTGENHRRVVNHGQTLSHDVISSTSGLRYVPTA